MINRIIFAVASFTLLGLVIFFWWHDTHAYQKAVGDVEDFKDTEIVVHPEVPLTPDKNIIWCGTLALSWNEAVRSLGGPLHFANPLPDAELLNRQEFTQADLDEESYVVVADTEDHHVTDQIRAGLKKKFGDTVPARLVPDDSSQDPKKFDAYACLYKNLEFPTPFHENIPLLFDWRQSASFGFGLEPGSGRDFGKNDGIVRKEVRVHSYVSDDDFVIQLKTKNEKDQLILAKVPPGKTLQATIDTVLPLFKADAEWGVADQDEMNVPKVDFDLTASFKQFQGQALTSADAQLDKITQQILFQLNENGVKLTSYATISTMLSVSSGTPPQPRHFIFNKPFLILLKRDSSTHPYFALWIGNPSLLVSP